MTSTTVLVKPRAIEPLRPSRFDRTKRLSLPAISMTTRPAADETLFEPLRPLGPSRVDRTKRLSLQATNTATKPAADETPFEPLRPFAPPHLHRTKRLSLGIINTTTRMAADEILVERIAETIASYRISGPGDKYEEGMKPKMLDTLRGFVAKQEPINMVVPAYPFKSPNRESKVLGPEPDVGERMTLQHFNSIGARIQRIYPPGGHVTIVSDGVCYNDLLGVSDEEVFDYAKGLHRITEDLGLKHLRFTDLFELMGGESSPTTAEEYASRVGKLKERLWVDFLPPGYVFDEEINRNKDALMTYRGYMKFLESDLATVFRAKGLSKSATKKHSSKVARGMIERGKCFSALVDSKCPPHVRLSIHASDNTRKLSMALLPHERYSSFPVTPWHNTPFLDVTNGSLSLGRKPTDTDFTYKACKDELGLSFLCAKAPMYSVIGPSEPVALDDQQVQLEPLYPFGLKVQVSDDTPITRFNLINVTELAKLHSLIIIKGLHPIQYASKVASDFFRRMAGDGLSLRMLHRGVAISTSASKAASYLAQVATLQDVSTASSKGLAKGYARGQVCLPNPFTEALQEVQNIWDSRICA